MSDRLSIAMAQINPTVGDVAGNLRRVREARAAAAAEGADLVVYPELVLAGYPPEDLVLQPAFQDRLQAAAEELAAETADGGPAMLVGVPWRVDGRLYNAVLLLDGGRVAGVRLKHDLPDHGVFDEARVFAAGALPGPVMCRGVRLGVMICEDMWTPDVAETLAESGAEILVVPNGSPYECDKGDRRLACAVERVTETGLPLIYVNQVGGQDELVFDGASFALDADRSLRAQLPAFAEQVAVSVWMRGAEGWSCSRAPMVAPAEGTAATYGALVLGLRDYVGKNGFPGVVLGLSGGIDSALAAAVAVDALGPDRVRAVMMPSPYTSEDSIADAAACAALLGIPLSTIPIAPAMHAFAAMLEGEFAGRAADATEENIQARARGVVLMALSNKLGHMVLATGNKSELAVGYATLHGDLCGGFAPLKDVYKTTVHALSRWRNAAAPPGGLGPPGRVIPERILTKAPSAELKPGQVDQDALPPYDELDAILRGFVEEEATIAEIVARGHEPDTVRHVRRMLDRAEHKRRQTAPGVKITRRAFGRDRRYPITNGFRG
ncbi:NAD+ synthase [Allostella sp. ATCC 35155]|nr:NAD+ synthase [Stella sp. ATCC 35155]